MPAKKLPDNLAIDVEEASKPELVKYMTKHKIDPPQVGSGSKNNVVKADLQKAITNWIDGKKAGSSNVIKKGAAAAATSPMEALTKTLAALLTTKNDTAPKKTLTKITEAPKWPGGDPVSPVNFKLWLRETREWYSIHSEAGHLDRQLVSELVKVFSFRVKEQIYSIIPQDEMSFEKIVSSLSAEHGVKESIDRRGLLLEYRALARSEKESIDDFMKRWTRTRARALNLGVIVPSMADPDDLMTASGSDEHDISNMLREMDRDYKIDDHEGRTLYVIKRMNDKRDAAALNKLRTVGQRPGDRPDGRKPRTAMLTMAELEEKVEQLEKEKECLYAPASYQKFPSKGAKGGGKGAKGKKGGGKGGGAQKEINKFATVKKDITHTNYKPKGKGKGQTQQPDWTCECGSSNWSRRQDCRQCQKTRP